MKLDKKTLVLGIGIIGILINIIFLVYFIQLNNTDGAKFKKEYESYNGEVAYGSYKYQDLKIPKKNKVKYATLDEILDIIKEDSGLIYFGFPDCPWCRGMLPTLLEVVDCSCLEELYYVDMTGMRDTYEVKDSEVVLTEKASSEYYELLEILDEYLLDYTVTDENGIEYETGEKRIYVPMILAVKDGEIVGAVSDTVTLNEDQSAFDELTDTQRDELTVKYNNLIELITEESTAEKNVCDEYC